MTETNSDRQIINCHTHIFTGDHVPPYLAKTFLPWPLYYLLPVSVFVKGFRFWYQRIAVLRYTAGYKQWQGIKTGVQYFFLKLGALSNLIGYYLAVVTILYANRMLGFFSVKLKIPFLNGVYQWMHEHHLLIAFDRIRWEALIFVLIMICLPSVRNIFLTTGKLFWNFLAKLPGEKTRDLLSRYLNIGRYAFHQHQSTIFSKLKAQYPPGTRIIVLPMDMEYMGAGKPTARFRDQMEELAEMKSKPASKDCFLPFLFIDPRRMVPVKEEIRNKPGDPIFFDFEPEDGKVILKDSFVKTYMEDKRFSGFKIYPALGYYPFDDRLLPLWKWAADEGLPIMSHCIRGTIFYRGSKANDWNRHPVFEQAMGNGTTGSGSGAIRNTGIRSDLEEWHDDQLRDDELEAQQHSVLYESLLLPQMKNVDFSTNFTHPMNFLCLLHEPLLRKLVGSAINRGKVPGLRSIFGFTDMDTPLQYDLSGLKICIAHFGGDDEWRRYYEKDRYNFSSQLIKYPKHGIRFFETYDRKPSRGKPEQIWKYTDWYSIVCSMMLQYENVYADISYILHDDAGILPLLKETLQNPGLRNKVLYGTDFFVVRNHKSDKNILADMQGGLSVEDFDQIARVNPEVFLENKL